MTVVPSMPFADYHALDRTWWSDCIECGERTSSGAMCTECGERTSSGAMCTECTSEDVRQQCADERSEAHGIP